MSNPTTTFLVVDDNELDVEKILRGFAKINVANQVVCAGNGYEAFDVLRGTNGREKIRTPFVILLDVNMPRMNGFEFLEELRADKSLAHAPVFILTTSDTQDDVDTAFRFNVCGYIVKPVAMDEMLEALATLNMYWTLSALPSDSASA